MSRGAVQNASPSSMVYSTADTISFFPYPFSPYLQQKALMNALLEGIPKQKNQLLLLLLLLAAFWHWNHPRERASR
jgi:hypothetical protein